MEDTKARGERLREARRHASLSVDQLAERTGYSASGVRAIENGQNGLRPDAADKFAPVLGVSAAWLLTGDGDRDTTPMARIIGRVGADTEGTVIQSTGQEAHDMAPVPPGGSKDSVALEVVGHSMRGLAEDGSLIYFEDQRHPPTPDMIGYYCIIETDDGRVLFKRLLRGSGPGLFMLESQIGPPIEDVRIRWAAEPTAIIPPKQARRIIRRAGERQVA